MGSLFDLDGKVALITGSAGGIGKEISRRLLQAGAKVFLVDYQQDLLMQTRDEFIEQYGGQVGAKKADVTKELEVKDAVLECLKLFSTVDILVNNAGIMKRVDVINFTLEDWSQVVEINLYGTFLFCREVGPEMIKRKAGKIVNISSTGGILGSRNNLPYSAAKAGVMGLSRSLALEWGEHNINVNCVAPYYVKTSLAEEILDNPKEYKRVIDRIPVKKLATAEDIANGVLFLASPASDMVTGHTLIIDGGCSIA